VRLHHDGKPLWVRADEYPLEDVLTHLLRNADRYRVPGSRITLTLRVHGPEALVDIHNQGPPIELALAERMFEYGVRGADEGAGEADDAHRGQGLFVARTYMAKMGGTITAVNVPDGVVFTLGLARAA
jgi:two-component system OmpR family sensor kinase